MKKLKLIIDWLFWKRTWFRVLFILFGIGLIPIAYAMYAFNLFSSYGPNTPFRDSLCILYIMGWALALADRDNVDSPANPFERNKMKGKIIITCEHISGCPMQWYLLLPDGSDGYMNFRFGWIALKQVTERAGLFQEPIIEEQIGGSYDGVLELSRAKEWLEINGYEVEIHPDYYVREEREDHY